MLRQVTQVIIVTLPTEETTQKRKPQIDGLFLNVLHI